MGKTAPGYGLQLPLSLVVFKPMTKSCFERGPIYTLIKIIIDCFRSKKKNWGCMGTYWGPTLGTNMGTTREPGMDPLTPAKVPH